MALALLTTSAFEKDLRRAEKQGKDLDKLEAIVDLLQARQSYRRAAGLTGCTAIDRPLGLSRGPGLGAPL